MKKMAAIIFLNAVSQEAASVVGQKWVLLSFLSKQFPVPNGFILTTEAYAQCSGQPNCQLPPELQEEIKSAYEKLVKKENGYLEDTLPDPVVIRTWTAGKEEKGYNAYNNAYNAVFALSGISALQEAVQQLYKQHKDEQHKEQTEQNQSSALVIFIQKMIDADAIGILETSYKMNKEEIRIRCWKGLGNVHTNPLLVPDYYFITKKTFRIAAVEFGNQPFFFQRNASTNKVEKLYLENSFRKVQKLTSLQLGELAMHSKAIEELFGRPQEISFGATRDALYFFGAQDAAWYEKEKTTKHSASAFSLPPLFPEQIEQKEQEIAIAVTAELENEQLLQSAVETAANMQVNSQQHSQIISEISDPYDVNQLVASIDFTELLEETAINEKILQQQSISSITSIPSSAPSVIFEKKIMNPLIENVPGENNEEDEEQSKSVKKLNSFEVARGNVIIECFKEVKQTVEQSQWGTTPELMHLAVIAQNFSQKNIPPTPKQVKYALDIVEKMKNSMDIL